MAVEEGLKIFQQIATTLEMPHEKGIVELKYVNVPRYYHRAFMCREPVLQTLWHIRCAAWLKISS